MGNYDKRIINPAGAQRPARAKLQDQGQLGSLREKAGCYGKWHGICPTQTHPGLRPLPHGVQRIHHAYYLGATIPLGAVPIEACCRLKPLHVLRHLLRHAKTTPPCQDGGPSRA